MLPGSRRGGKRVGPVTRRRTCWAVYKEVHVPELEERRRMHWAGDEEAYAPDCVQGGARAQAVCKEVNAPGREEASALIQRPGGGRAKLWTRRRTHQA